MLNYRKKFLIVISLLFTMPILFACSEEESTTESSTSGSNTLATIILHDLFQRICSGQLQNAVKQL